MDSFPDTVTDLYHEFAELNPTSEASSVFVRENSCEALEVWEDGE